MKWVEIGVLKLVYQLIVKNRKMKKSALLLFTCLAVFTACKKDKKNTVTNPANPNSEEVITTFKITFVDPNGIQPSVIAQFIDLDGPGGNAPITFDTIALAANSFYNANIHLLNESVTPIDTITHEIVAEGVDHLFCFDADASLNLTIQRTDLDANNLPIGITSSWTTTGSSTGYTIIRLKHQPGVKDGTCSPGDTDIELSFFTKIQ